MNKVVGVALLALNSTLSAGIGPEGNINSLLSEGALWLTQDPDSSSVPEFYVVDLELDLDLSSDQVTQNRHKHRGHVTILKIAQPNPMPDEANSELTMEIVGGSLRADDLLSIGGKQYRTHLSPGEGSHLTLRSSDTSGLYQVDSFFDIFTDLRFEDINDDESTIFDPLYDMDRATAGARATATGVSQHPSSVVHTSTDVRTATESSDPRNKLELTDVEISNLSLTMGDIDVNQPLAPSAPGEEWLTSSSALEPSLDFIPFQGVVDIDSDGDSVPGVTHPDQQVEGVLTVVRGASSGENLDSVPIEIVALSLRSLDPVPVGPAAIAIPNLIEARKGANESAAISTLREGSGGGYVVDSFFDIFTEIELTPTDQAGNPTGATPERLELGDFDRDGLPDVALRLSASNLSRWPDPNVVWGIDGVSFVDFYGEGEDPNSTSPQLRLSNLRMQFVVPEPGSFTLLSSSLLFLARRRRSE